MEQPLHNLVSTEQITQRIRQIAPDLVLQINDFDEYQAIILPIPPGAEYAFEVLVYPSEEPQLSARLVAEPDAYFCYLPFERDDYPSDQAQFEQFCLELNRILRCPTRITQRKALLFWHFVCAFYDQQNWTDLGGVSCLRWGFPVPKIEGPRKEYFSPPIL